MKYIELNKNQIEYIRNFTEQTSNAKAVLRETKLYNGDMLCLVIESTTLGNYKLYWCNRKNLEI